MHLKDTSFEKIVFTERLVSSRSKRPTNYVSKVGKLPTSSASNLQLSLTVKTHYARLCNLKGGKLCVFYQQAKWGLHPSISIKQSCFKMTARGVTSRLSRSLIRTSRLSLNSFGQGTLLCQSSFQLPLKGQDGLQERGMAKREMSSKAKLESVLGKFTSVQLISSRLRRNTGLKEAAGKCAQLSNLRWMPNSVSKGFGTAIKTGSSRRFKRYPTTHMWVSSWLPFTVD